MSNAEFYTATGLHSQLTSYINQRKTSFSFGKEASPQLLETVKQLEFTLDAVKNQNVLQICQWVKRNIDDLKTILPGEKSPYQKLKNYALEMIDWCIDQADNNPASRYLRTPA